MRRRLIQFSVTVLPVIGVLVLLAWGTRAEMKSFAREEMGARQKDALNPAQQTRRGSERFVPTRLEWPALELNSTGRRSQAHGHRFSLMYVPLHGKDAIAIYVGHEVDVHHALMTKAIEHAREMVIETAKTHGWDEWVNIIEIVQQDADKAAENRTSSG